MHMDLLRSLKISSDAEMCNTSSRTALTPEVCVSPVLQLVALSHKACDGLCCGAICNERGLPLVPAGLHSACGLTNAFGLIMLQRYMKKSDVVGDPTQANPPFPRL